MVRLQAIGSEVAAETNRSEVMNAPARLTASWRLSTNEKDILDTPFFEPRLGSQLSLQGVCQLKIIVIFQCLKTTIGENC